MKYHLAILTPGWIELILCFSCHTRPPMPHDRIRQELNNLQNRSPKMQKTQRLDEQKHMLEKGFEVLSEHVRDLIENHSVMPAEISIPYKENGRWIRLRLVMSPVKDEDPEETAHEKE